MEASHLLRHTRTTAGMTQAQLARRAGTSQAAVARYERGTVSPAVSTLERMLHAAGARLELSVSPASSTDLSGVRAAKLRRHRREIVRLAREAGATNVRVFGSTARGEDLPESDIDLLVDFDTTRGLMALISLGRQIEELLDERVDVVPASLLKPHVAQRAQLEAVAL